MNLEDTHLDVLLKAQKAQGITDRDLVKLAEITVPDLNNLRAGRREPTAIEKIARVLNLRPEAIIDLANSRWNAPAAALPPHVLKFTTPFADMTVNHYLVWDPKTLKAVAFDAGTNADPLFAALERHKLTLTHIFLTHSHGDHILELDRIREKTKAKAYAPDAEPIEGCEQYLTQKSLRSALLRSPPTPFPATRLGERFMKFMASIPLWPLSVM